MSTKITTQQQPPPPVTLLANTSTTNTNTTTNGHNNNNNNTNEQKQQQQNNISENTNNNITTTTEVDEMTKQEKSILSKSDHLVQEDDDGNIEYKWKLVNVSADRFKHLVTQMSYRLSEGQGEAIYELGIKDNGFPEGLDEDEFNESVDTIKRMAAELHADVSIICMKELSPESVRTATTTGENNKKQTTSSTLTDTNGNGGGSEQQQQQQKRKKSQKKGMNVVVDPIAQIPSSSTTSSTTTSSIQSVSSTSSLFGDHDDEDHHNNGSQTSSSSSSSSSPQGVKKRKVAELLVRKFGDEQYMDLRIAVCGNVDSGKSTLIGVLTRGQLDNGRGLARANVFLHKHEIDTGRTSAISHQIMGYDSRGQIVNYGLFGTPSWKEIIEKSSKVCTFIDLAGHEKYLKTTVFGMTGNIPDYACVVIGANMGVTRMTKEHLGLCLALKIPIFICVTKIDICPENVLKQTIATIHKILKLPGVRKLPYHIKTEDDVLTCSKNIVSDRVTPIFMMSSVTGHHMDLLRQFMNLLPVRRDWESLIDKPTEFVIDQTFFVTGVGTVVSGIVLQGSVSVNDTLMLGPDGNGHFKSVTVKSIHCKRVNVRKVHAGQTASFALKKEKRSGIRKGMVLVEPKFAKATWEFEAEVLVLYHSTTIKENYQPVIHCSCVRQSAKIIKMDSESIRTGDKATVRFRFMFRPEYLRLGERLIFREGRTKGLGIISKIY